MFGDDSCAGHFIVICGVALASPVAVEGLNQRTPTESPLDGCSIIEECPLKDSPKQHGEGGCVTAPEESRNCAAVFVEEAKLGFSAGIRSCQVEAFIYRDPANPEASWITADRLDMCRDADGELLVR